MSLPCLRACACARAVRNGDQTEGLAQVMFSRLTRGKHSLLAGSRARSNECLGRKPIGPKHSIMILLHMPKTKCPGMIFLQDASIRSETRKRALLHNSIRICTLKDKHAQGMVGAKPFRMISLQNSSNKTPGIISLQKKVGGRGAPLGRAKVMEIRSFRALTKSGAHFPCQTAPGAATAVECGRAVLRHDLIAHCA